ncbi:MAG: hypothetical protein JWM98_1718 [Thermoleophilia bacterium]|nr:hypothetical protein [Thermoleophilia bacterium]
MRNRTFLGLIFLVAALLVASTPQLLAPTSRGVELVAIKAGVMQDPAKAAPHRPKRSGKGGNAAEGQLVVQGYKLAPAAGEQMMIKGYFVDPKTGDMVDGSDIGVRGAHPTRLAAGADRARLPGAPVIDRVNPPVLSQDGVLLDITNCPVFPADANVASIIADPTTKQLYANKAASADDPKACRTALDATIKAAVSPTGFALPGDRRQLAASVRTDSQRLMFDLYANGMYQDVFAGWLTAPATAVKIKGNLASGG